MDASGQEALEVMISEVCDFLEGFGGSGVIWMVSGIVEVKVSNVLFPQQ